MEKTINTTIIIGLGKTGLSCVSYLRQQGRNVVVMDTRKLPPGIDEMKRLYPEVKVITGELEPAILSQAAEIIISPGLSTKEPAIAEASAQGIRVIGDIELFVRAANAPIVAITGTNGKSTVTTLIGDMALKAKLNVGVGGNLGEPALDLLSDQVDLYVLELSSYQLETTHSLKAKVAVNLNVSPDHLDRYDSFQDYANAKLKIYEKCQTAVINRDDPLSFKNVAMPSQVLSFGFKKMKDEFTLIKLDGKWSIAKGDNPIICADEIALKGMHQLKNCMAALAIAELLELPIKQCLAVLREFKGLKHRCQLIRDHAGVAWYDDSKGTNVGAVTAAINGLGSLISGKIILIAGGQGKESDYGELDHVVKQYVKRVVLIGEDANKIYHQLNPIADCEFASDMSDAVEKANQVAKSGDIVLLSPACASFDMFKNFEHRGDTFIEAVNSL